ncbi:MAG TPA: hypothetical protein VL242_10155 [Sorangium sp.]|nr:hypothetical protein [Sorangium sp.]
MLQAHAVPGRVGENLARIAGAARRAAAAPAVYARWEYAAREP